MFGDRFNQPFDLPLEPGAAPADGPFADQLDQRQRPLGRLPLAGELTRLLGN